METDLIVLFPKVSRFGKDQISFSTGIQYKLSSAVIWNPTTLTPRVDSAQLLSKIVKQWKRNQKFLSLSPCPCLRLPTLFERISILFFGSSEKFKRKSKVLNFREVPFPLATAIIFILRTQRDPCSYFYRNWEGGTRISIDEDSSFLLIKA